jgi:hypothetical protein
LADGGRGRFRGREKGGTFENAQRFEDYPVQETELAIDEVGGCAVACPAGYVYAVETLVEEGAELGQFRENDGLG